MNFTLLDNNVSTEMNVFLIIANIINLVYNIPQIVKTIKTKSTKDFSEWFLGLRIVGNLIWMAYAIEINSFMLLLNSLVTVISSLIISIYKIKELGLVGIKNCFFCSKQIDIYDTNEISYYELNSF